MVYPCVFGLTPCANPHPVWCKWHAGWTQDPVSCRQHRGLVWAHTSCSAPARLALRAGSGAGADQAVWEPASKASLEWPCMQHIPHASPLVLHAVCVASSALCAVFSMCRPQGLLCTQYMRPALDMCYLWHAGWAQCYGGGERGAMAWAACNVLDQPPLLLAMLDPACVLQVTHSMLALSDICTGSPGHRVLHVVCVLDPAP